MRAVDVKINLTLNKNSQQYADLHEIMDSYDTEDEVNAMDDFEESGCPIHISKFYIKTCRPNNSGCKECWEQTAYQFQEQYPDLYKKE